ncbi:MAG: VCBS repeat-containing protein [Gammaproteobacteria bacterium]
MVSGLPDKLPKESSGIIKSLNFLFLVFFIFSCASGGSSQVEPIISPQTTPQETDKRIPFESFKNQMVSPWGYINAEYSVGSFIPSSQLPSNNKYRIEDYGFLKVTTVGTHPGDSSNSDEVSLPGPYLTSGQWFEANLNNDGHTDLIYVGSNCCNRNYVLEDLMLAFINDGNGHFALSRSIFAEDVFPCVQGGRSWLADEFDPLHPCGNQQDYTNGKIVADFNGDGISDYYDTSILYLSNAEGKLENKSLTNLPGLFFEPAHGQIFVHDATYGDLDGDGDLDIFVPISDYTEHGFRFGGAIDPCSGCSDQIPYTALINDGSGSFSANHLIPIFNNWVEVDYDNHGHGLDILWPTTAAIGDFDNDGFGDIALGWFNPRISHLYGFSEFSSGVVYFNNGSNDWTLRDYVELPANYFASNGNANDMEVFDFDGDGFVDIVLASTIHDPYYQSRVIQFFKNNGGSSFTDVTSSISPDHAKYASGNPYSNWWVGQGKIHILDYDHDGDLDIIDVNTRTSVFINNGSTFNLYDYFVDTDEDILLWPVEIDGKYHYDFIGSKQTCGGDTCVTNFYQLLDPPSYLLLQDFFTKTGNYVEALLEASYLGDEIRVMLSRNNLVHQSYENLNLLGFSSQANNLQFIGGGIMGKHLGNFFGITYENNLFRGGVILNHSSVHAFNRTRWFGAYSADLFYENTERFFEINILKSRTWLFSLGHLLSDTYLNDFSEEGGTSNFSYIGSKLSYSAGYTNLMYRSNFWGVNSEIILGSRRGKSIQPFFMRSSTNFDFQSVHSIANDYFGLNLHSGPYYLKLSASSVFGEQVHLGFQINF